MNKRIMDDNDSDSEPIRRPTSKRGTRRMSTEELIVDAQAKQATQAQEAQAALIQMLATSQSDAMGTLAKAMDRTSKPVPLNTSMVVDKVGKEVYSLEKFKTIDNRYPTKEVAHHMHKARKRSNNNQTFK